MGSGLSTLFWFDRWAGNRPFATGFPELFSICVAAHIFVEAALIDLRGAFCRSFGPVEQAAWENLLECVALHTPSLAPD